MMWSLDGVFVFSAAFIAGVIVGAVASHFLRRRPAWRVMLSIVPGPVLAWVNKWLAVFDGATFLSSHAWVQQADRNAAALSVPFVIISALVGGQEARSTLRRAILWSVVSAIGFAFACFCLRLFLAGPTDQPRLSETLELIWQALYVLMIVSLTLAITLAALLPGSDKTP